MTNILLGAVALAFSASAASAAISVDGTLDAEYGAATATVAYNPAAPRDNFGTPTNEDQFTSYSIYGKVQGDTLYALFQSDAGVGTPIGPFVNLYLDTNPPLTVSGGGSDVGFEVTNDRAFIPGQPGYASNLGLDIFQGGSAATGFVVEFAIPLSLLRNGIPGLGAFPNVAPGGFFTFRLSQAFGYSVAGGTTYGGNRLGAFQMPAVPEPASWAMMIGGFGLAGAAMRRRVRTTVAFA
jgi:hypothetical protein